MTQFLKYFIFTSW